MTFTNSAVGAQLATAVPISSPNAQKNAIVPTTISEVLDLLEKTGAKGMPMLRTTHGVLANFLSTSTDRLTVQSVWDAKDLFRQYLVGRKYAENSIRTYVNHAKILINTARASGWIPVDTVPSEWQEVLAAAKKQVIKKSLVKYLASTRPTPAVVTSEDTDRWTGEMIKKGFSMPHTRRTVGWLWRTVTRLGVAGDRASVCPTKYQVPVAQLPSRLKAEVTELLKWKQAEFAPGRPSDCQHRAVTAGALKSVLCRLYGYALSVRGEAGIKCLADLVTQDTVTGFVDWRINERRNGGYSVHIGLGMLRAALRYHPAHNKIDLSWWDDLLAGIPVESEEDRRARKKRKFVPYAVLEQIPAQIQQDRSKLPKSSDKVSTMAMQELLMLWLQILPWRQKNIREMRVSGPEPNIFKDVIDPFGELKKPD